MLHRDLCAQSTVVIYADFTPPFHPLLCVFFSQLHMPKKKKRKKKSALEFIFGKMVPQLIRTKEQSSPCLVLQAQDPEAPPATETKQGSVKPELELRAFIHGVERFVIPSHQQHLSVCPGVNRSSKSS